MTPTSRPARSRLSRADLEAVLVTVRLAYEGLAQREAWVEMLRQVRQLFRARDVFLVRTPLELGGTSLSMTEGVDPGLQRRYSTGFTVPLTNPSIAAALELGREGTVVTSDIVPWQRMEKTDFYEVIRRPRGVRWEIVGGRATATDSRRYLTVNRHTSGPRFASREEALMDHLWPHVDQVLRLQDEGARREAEQRRLAGALQADPDGLLYLEGSGRVHPINDEGMELLSERGRRREARNVEDVSEPFRPVLQEMRLFLLRLGDPARPPVGLPPEREVRLPSLGPIRIRAEVCFESGIPRGLLVRCHPVRRLSRKDEVDLSGWGFTPREGEVAHALLQGSSGDEICRDLQISGDTLKSHLRHLRQKTGSRGRTQLMARLFLGPGSEDPRG
jgi:DNA-binding CsgD family transcriptional regulator